jgi:hypothetical protein
MFNKYVETSESTVTDDETNQRTERMAVFPGQPSLVDPKSDLAPFL